MTTNSTLAQRLRDIVAAYEHIAADPTSRGVIYTFYNAKTHAAAPSRLDALDKIEKAARACCWPLVADNSGRMDDPRVNLNAALAVYDAALASGGREGTRWDYRS